jgi:CubicO group peptidase (beta-lactamase class C family)
MKFFRKKRYWLTTLVLLPVLVGGYFFIRLDLATQFAIASGWKAKILSSGVFISGRPAESVLREDIAVHPLLKFVSSRVDEERQEVRASFLGLIGNRAVLDGRLGTVLLDGVPVDPQEVDWPTGDRVPAGDIPPNVDRGLLERAVDRAFAESGPDSRLRTRAILVVYDDRIVAERYAEGITPETPLIGWSMSKSVTSALVGILVGQGRLSVLDPAPVPEWQNPGDPRRAITLEQLLWMSSGLEWEEAYETKPISDVNRMLFTRPDTAAYAAGLPLEAQPGTKWNYSTGTTQIISRIIRQTFADQAEYLAFPRTALFNKIGMRGALITPDASGTFVGGAFVFACARDWARFGLLYLHDGMWAGERVLPEGWVKFTTTPAPAGKGIYGAQFWLNQGELDEPGTKRLYAEAPHDLFYCAGYQTQLVIVIPSRRLVLVRLGMTTRGVWSMDDFVSAVLRAIPEG